MELCMFDMPYLRITQKEYGTYSHKGSKATDHGGKNSSSDTPLFAPFSGYYARIRTVSSHETYFVSEKPVQCANGYVGIVTLTFMHDEYLDHNTGDFVKQGAKIGDEGGFGKSKHNYFAHHSHQEFSTGKQTMQVPNGYGVYYTPNQISIYDACYLSPNTLVHIGNYQYKRADELAVNGVVSYMGYSFKLAGSSIPITYSATTTANLNIRTAPGTANAKVGLLPKGTVVTVLENLNGWSRIAAGWVCASYLK